MRRIRTTKDGRTFTADRQGLNVKEFINGKECDVSVYDAHWFPPVSRDINKAMEVIAMDWMKYGSYWNA